uniref:Uncharacterized protein n=1 Tax=Arundo donax TaxID=35708 RepID=A0A0A9D566_ARUDO
MEATEMMNQVVKGLKATGIGGILMVEEDEGEDALGEVIVIKVTTLGQEMVVVGALAGVIGAEVVSETGTITMREGPSVKVVAGLNLLTGIPTKGAVMEIKLSQKASLAGGLTTMIAGECQKYLVGMIRQERVMETTHGVKTVHLLLSWVSLAVLPRMLPHGVLLVTPRLVEVLEAEVLEKSNEDSWNSSKGAEGTEKSSWDGSEAAPKKDGEASGSQGGGGGSSWDKVDGAWNSNKGSDAGSGGW